MGTRLQQSGVRLGSHDIGARGAECNDQSFKHNIWQLCMHGWNFYIWQLCMHGWNFYICTLIDKSCKGCKTAASTLKKTLCCCAQKFVVLSELPGVRLRHSVPPVEYIQRIVRVGGCLAVVAQWQSAGGSSHAEVSWVQLPVTASLITFLYVRLITSIFLFVILIASMNKLKCLLRILVFPRTLYSFWGPSTYVVSSV